MNRYPLSLEYFVSIAFDKKSNAINELKSLCLTLSEKDKIYMRNVSEFIDNLIANEGLFAEREKTKVALHKFVAEYKSSKGFEESRLCKLVLDCMTLTTAENELEYSKAIKIFQDFKFALDLCIKEYF